MNASDFRELVSGRRRGAAASLLRGLLRAAEVPYSWGVRWRNRRYDRGAAPAHSAGVPVICVGNLTLGGTGKTPMVEWIARWLRGRGVRVTLVSRGYGAEEGARNDEALELEQKLPDVPHLQNADRVAAARLAVEEFDCQVVLLDDGFQHRRLKRDLDVVLLDALEPFGFGHVFPRGTLREPPGGLRRAHVVALSRADLVDEQQRRRIRDEVQQLAPHVLWLETAHAPRGLLDCRGGVQPLESLGGQPVAAFCGIGNPAGFRRTLQGLDYQLVGFREFADHHPYSRDDVHQLARWAADRGASALLCTHKDLVKLAVERLGDVPLWALAVGLEISHGREAFEERLVALLPAAAEGGRAAGV